MPCNRPPKDPQRVATSTYGPSKRRCKGSLRVKRVPRDIGFNVPILTGRDGDRIRLQYTGLKHNFSILNENGDISSNMPSTFHSTYDVANTAIELNEKQETGV